MKTKQIISAGLESFYSLIKVIEKDIDWDDVEPHQNKVVIEGRYLAFTTASSQLNMIKDLKKQINDFNEDIHKEKIEELIDSTSKILTQLRDVLGADIKVKDIDDEKFKSVVMAKDVAFKFLLEINATKSSMQASLKKNTTNNVTSGNLATDRVKNG